ncbi:MAG: hypothetical protein CVU38_07895 [Chloroflexi bacterium HGW-Chloroflexi-1]|nr:MAG: hypothetical protein CVU38_07895 [Chloroflexi bacterium HGW-Chloroflexi-1]
MVTAALPTIRLYFDEDADGRLVQAVRQRGYDIQLARQANMLGASDDDQLAYAVSQGRAFVTHNVQHFPPLCAEWEAAGREHSGVIMLLGRPTIGIWLRRLENLLSSFGAEDLKNALVFLGVEFD